MLTLAVTVATVLILSYVALLEKRAIRAHRITHFSLSRAFYMLLLVLVVMLVLEPRVLASSDMRAALRDPVVLQAGALTALGMLMYFWVLSRVPLSRASMVWPAVMLCTVVAAAAALSEPLTAVQWAGVSVAVIGLSMVLGGGALRTPA